MQRILVIAMLAAAVSAPAMAHSGARAPAAAADPHHTWIYVGGPKNVIDVYDLDLPGTPHIERIENGLSEPAGMAVGADGTLYVANLNEFKPGSNVVAFAPGATSPTQTWTTGLTVAVGVAVDAHGTLYVSNRSTPSGIVVFPNGATSPSYVITSRYIRLPSQLVFDRSGNLFFGDYQTVGEVPRGSKHARSLGLFGLLGEGGLAFAPSTDDLYVANGSIGPVMVYGRGETRPHAILQEATGACFLASATIAGTPLVFVPSCNNDTVWLFQPPHRRPLATLHLRGTGNACCIAIKPAGVP
jgi:sugar lactone lactonase YvrE